MGQQLEEVGDPNDTVSVKVGRVPGIRTPHPQHVQKVGHADATASVEIPRTRTGVKAAVI
jgi:hypothetical protein